ncbi:hypothetical protein DPEC_G00323870 [Dallia pectoralis]|uniref:Uncharacterized protein n=1 Tax=Dallia pectoralis TaxID=75939 RepID=A0ACC2FAV4_DALPE|nr:hypothetical protein DPEC_G00323870 [Dallia pectoralis]
MSCVFSVEQAARIWLGKASPTRCVGGERRDGWRLYIVSLPKPRRDAERCSAASSVHCTPPPVSHSCTGNHRQLSSAGGQRGEEESEDRREGPEGSGLLFRVII